MKTTEPPRAKSTSYKHDVLALASGTVVGQILTILTAPLLARLFSPEAFGTFALITSIAAILASVSSLQYDQAIVLPEKDGDAANLLVGALGISILFSLLLIPILFLLGPALATWLNAPTIISYLWLIPFIVFFGGLGAGHPAVTAWAARTRRFAEISTARVAGSVTTTLAKLGAGFAGFASGGGLLVGSMTGSILAPIILGVQVWREDRPVFFKSVGFDQIRQSLVRYRKFAVYNTPSALLNTLSIFAPQFLLAAFFSPVVVGFYAFGYQLLSIPMQLIGASVSQAFYPHAASANRQKELAVFVENTFRRLIEYSLFPGLILMVSGSELFSVVLGSQWAEAGKYAQILSLWMIFWFISIPLSNLINVLEKNEFYFRWNLITLLTGVVSIWLGAIMGSPLLSLAFFSFSGACIFAYISYWVTLKAGVAWKKVAAMLLQNLAIFVPAGGVLLVSKIISLPELAVAALAISLSGLYFLYRVRKEPTFSFLLTRARDFLLK